MPLKMCEYTTEMLSELTEQQKIEMVAEKIGVVDLGEFTAGKLKGEEEKLEEQERREKQLVEVQNVVAEARSCGVGRVEKAKKVGDESKKS